MATLDPLVTATIPAQQLADFVTVSLRLVAGSPQDFVLFRHPMGDRSDI